MIEYGILLKNGETMIIFGYSYVDALKKSKISSNEVQAILTRDYID